MLNAENNVGHADSYTSFTRILGNPEVGPLVSFYSEILRLREVTRHHISTGFAYLDREESIKLLDELETLFTGLQDFEDHMQTGFAFFSGRVLISSEAKPPFSLLADREIWGVYPAPWSGNAWNAFRGGRILVASMCLNMNREIQTRFNDISLSRDPEYYQNDVEKLSDSILGSVFCTLWPELFEGHSEISTPADSIDTLGSNETTSKDDTKVNTTSSSFIWDPQFPTIDIGLRDWTALEPPKPGHTLALLWPLHLLTGSIYSPLQHQLYAQEILTYISEVVGLRGASVLGQLPVFDTFLRSEQKIDIWNQRPNSV